MNIFGVSCLWLMKYALSISKQEHRTRCRRVQSAYIVCTTKYKDSIRYLMKNCVSSHAQQNVQSTALVQ